MLCPAVVFRFWDLGRLEGPAEAIFGEVGGEGILKIRGKDEDTSEEERNRRGWILKGEERKMKS